MKYKLTDWENEYIEKHLPGKCKDDFYYDNPSAAQEDIEWLIELIKKIQSE
jgi:hypothetical protein